MLLQTIEAGRFGQHASLFSTIRSESVFLHLCLPLFVCEKDLLEINNEFPVSELVRNIIEQMQLQSICMTIVRVDKCDHKQMWIAVQYIVHSFYEKERNVLLYVEVKSIKLK